MFDRNDTPDDKEDSLTAALTTLYRQKERKIAEATGRTPFAAVVDHFQRRSQRLSEEKRTTEALVSHLVGGLAKLPRRPVAPTIEIRTQANVGSAFVRVANTSERPVTVAWVIGQSAAGLHVPRITFTPESPALAAGAACLVEVSVDLGGWQEADRFVIPVECRAGDRRDRLQLVIYVESGQP